MDNQNQMGFTDLSVLLCTSAYCWKVPIFTNQADLSSACSQERSEPMLTLASCEVEQHST